MDGIPHRSMAQNVSAAPRATGNPIARRDTRQGAASSQGRDQISTVRNAPYPVTDFHATLQTLEAKIDQIQIEINRTGLSFIQNNPGRFQFRNSVPSSSDYPKVVRYDQHQATESQGQSIPLQGDEKIKARHIAEKMRQYDDLVHLHHDLVQKFHVRNSTTYPSVMQYEKVSNRCFYHFDFPVHFGP